MEACTLADSSGTSVPYGLVDGVLLHHAAIAAHEFGLYGALAAAPLTRGAAATLLGLSERVVAHLVGAAEAFGLVSSDGGVLSLTPVGRAFTIGPDGGPSAFLEFGSVAV
ncbi:MAG: hypothetical protein JNK60_14720, partial [Acidobacteria bacterium]|nr:hypothetical protein [Acidobacteriota bacterium]